MTAFCFLGMDFLQHFTPHASFASVGPSCAIGPHFLYHCFIYFFGHVNTDQDDCKISFVYCAEIFGKYRYVTTHYCIHGWRDIPKQATMGSLENITWTAWLQWVIVGEMTEGIRRADEHLQDARRVTQGRPRCPPDEKRR